MTMIENLGVCTNIFEVWGRHFAQLQVRQSSFRRKPESRDSVVSKPPAISRWSRSHYIGTLPAGRNEVKFPAVEEAAVAELDLGNDEERHKREGHKGGAQG